MITLDVTTRIGSKAREHRVELVSGDIQADHGRLRLTLDGKATEIDWAEIGPGRFSIIASGRSYRVWIEGCGVAGRLESPVPVTVGQQQYSTEIRDPRVRRHSGPPVGPVGPQEIVAPMPGKIVKVLIKEKEDVALGDGLVVIEAMKMQNELRALRAGHVAKIYVSEGSRVETGAKLLRLE